MVKLRNMGGDCSVFAPEGVPGAVFVDTKGILTVPGELAKPPTRKQMEEGASPLPDDAIIVVTPDGDVRAYPTSRWELIDTKDKPSDSADTSGS